MDKETLSHYGWIVICILVLSIMIAMATPFGDYIGNTVKSTTQGLFDVQQKAMGTAGLEVMQQEFEDMFNGGENGETLPPETPQNVLPVFNQPYRTVVTADGLELMYEFVFYADGSASMWAEYLNGEYAGMSVGEFAPTGTYKYQGNTIIDTTVEGGTPLTISADGKTLSDGEITMTLNVVEIGSLQQDTIYSGNYAAFGLSLSATFNTDGTINIDDGSTNEFVPADAIEYYDTYIVLKGAEGEEDTYCPIYPDGTKVAFGLFVLEIQGPPEPCPIYFGITYIADDNTGGIIIFYEDGSFEFDGSTLPSGFLSYNGTKIYYQGQLLGTVSADGVHFQMTLNGATQGFTIEILPTTNTITYTSITLNAIDGCEYSIDGENWQDSPAFTGLNHGTKYTIYVRYKATDVKPASPSSSKDFSTVTLPAPAVSERTPTSITLNVIDGCEYSIDGEIWQDSPTFSDLIDGTEYTFYARYKGTNAVSSAKLKTVVCTDFGVYQSSREKVGYTGVENEELVIPAIFYDDEDGKWYKVTLIGFDAFRNCTNLKSVTIPDSVTRIDGFAFGYCENLTSVAIPNSVTYIGSYAFTDCTSLTSITIPDGVTHIYAHTFYKCTSLTSIIIPDGVTSIGDEAFLGCTNLTNINIPDSVTSIGEKAFQNCTSLTSITIPDGVKSIPSHAFYNCQSLTSITIPDSVTSIGEWAFYDCDSLHSITFEGTVEQWNAISKIGENSNYDWNYDCSEITVNCKDGTVIVPDFFGK